jgi:hypothetical protein
MLFENEHIMSFFLYWFSDDYILIFFFEGKREILKPIIHEGYAYKMVDYRVF